MMSKKDPKESGYSPAQKGGAHWLKLVEDKKLQMSNFEKKVGLFVRYPIGPFS